MKVANCKGYKVTGSWNLKVWYTMTLWDNENELNNFYRNGKHLEAMKQSRKFSSKIQSHRIELDDLMPWKELKKKFKQM